MKKKRKKKNTNSCAFLLAYTATDRRANRRYGSGLLRYRKQQAHLHPDIGHHGREPAFAITTACSSDTSVKGAVSRVPYGHILTRMWKRQPRRDNRQPYLEEQQNTHKFRHAKRSTGKWLIEVTLHSWVICDGSENRSSKLVMLPLDLDVEQSLMIRALLPGPFQLLRLVVLELTANLLLELRTADLLKHLFFL